MSSNGTASPSIIYLGLDVHKESITIAVLPATAAAPTHVDKLANDAVKLRRYFQRLASDGAELRACYEASGAGYVLQRAMRELGHHCEVIAPSLIPTKPGVQRKYDKYDAVQLARLYRAGELTAVRIPTEAEERVRDLVRCRETFQREILKSRHYLLKFLARRGLVYREGTNWSSPHWRWLRQLAAADTLGGEDAVVFGEYLALLEYKIARREDLDGRIQALALTPTLAPMVGRLQCFRGVQVHVAMVLATELVDWRRFEDPRQLMAYVGLVPSEDSSGDRRRLGAITKAGNRHCRHALVQAAWSYRYRPNQSPQLTARQRGHPAPVIAHAWKAQHRLYKLFTRLAERKRPQIAAVAVARELIGFLWSVMQTLEPMPSPSATAA